MTETSQLIGLITGSGGALAVCVIVGIFGYKHLNRQIQFWMKKYEEENTEKGRVYDELTKCTKSNSDILDKILTVVNKVEHNTNGKLDRFKNDLTNEVLKNREEIMKK